MIFINVQIYGNMIKLKSLLEDIDFGKLLWADPSTAEHGARYLKFLTKVYGRARETDSREEADLWKAIRAYLASFSKRGIDDAALKQLLSMKTKFPAQLDPQLAQDDRLYRGQTLAVAELADWIENESYALVPEDRNWWKLTVNRQPVQSRSDVFISMTKSLATASEFARTPKPAGRYPVIVSCRYKDVESRALMNSEYLDMLGDFAEQEVWIVGNTMLASEIYIISPWTDSILHQASWSTSRSDRARIAQALKRRGFSKTSALD